MIYEANKILYISISSRPVLGFTPKLRLIDGHGIDHQNPNDIVEYIFILASTRLFFVFCKTFSRSLFISYI